MSSSERSASAQPAELVIDKRHRGGANHNPVMSSRTTRFFGRLRT